MQHGDMVKGDGGSPTPLLRFLGDQGKKSSKKGILKDAIEHEILSRDRVDMSTIGFEPKISSYIEAILRRGLISSSSSSSAAASAFSTGVCCFLVVVVFTSRRSQFIVSILDGRGRKRLLLLLLDSSIRFQSLREPCLRHLIG